MDIGTLTIQMLSDMAQLKRDMGDAKSVVGDAMGEISKYADMAKTALIGFAGIGSVMGFASMIDGSIKSAAALEGLAMQAGMSGEALSSLVQVGKMSGTSAEDIADSVNKLQKAMAASVDDTGKAGKALADIGINFAEFKDLSPDEQMVAVGQAMNEFADGTGKSQVAMDLFGKTGAQMLEYLKDLGDTQQLNAKFTDEQITQSRLFEVEIKKITASGKGWKDELAMGMLPALQDTAEATLGLLNGSGGLRAEIKELTADGSIAEWTRSVITSMTYLMDGFSYGKDLVASFGIIMGHTIDSAIDGLGTFGKIVMDVLGGRFKDAVNEYSAASDRATARDMALNDSLKQTWGGDTLGQRLRDRISEVHAHGVAQAEDKDQVDHNTDAVDANVESLSKAIAAGEKSIASIELKNTQLQQEIDLGRKLTDGEKEFLKLVDDMTSGTIVLTKAQYEHATAVIANTTNLQMAIQINEQVKKQIEEMTKAHAAEDAAMLKKTESMQATNDKMSEQNLALLMGKDACEQHKVALLLDEAAQLEASAAVITDTGERVKNSAQLLEQARILRERAGLAQDGIVIKEAVEAQKAWEQTTKAIGDGLSSALTGALMNGRSLWDAFKAYLINTILDGAIKNALSSVIQGGLNSMLGSLGINVAGSTVGSAAGGSSLLGSTLGSVGTSAGSALGIGAGGFTGTGLTGALGIGASAGAGVTTTGIATGSAVGTDLGLLGSSAAGSTAAAAGGAAAGSGMAMGSLSATGFGAMAAGVYVLGSAISNAMGWGSPNWQPSGPAGSMVQDGLTYQYQQVTDTTSGDIMFKVLDPTGDLEQISNLNNIAYQMAMQKWLNSNTSTFEGGGAFADGGDHPGGWRLVGENGPELEATGPSRIFDAQTTASMLRSGGSGGAELAQEMRMLREEVRGLRASVERGNENTQSAADSLKGRQSAPLLVQVVTV